MEAIPMMGVIRLIFQAFWFLAGHAAGMPPSRGRQLAALRELDDRLLADVGITRLEARLGRPLRSRDGD